MKKKTVIIGATPNPARYAFMAAGELSDAGHEIVPVGIRKGNLFGKDILDIRLKPAITNVDDVTLYIGPRHQPEWYDYILGLKPKRIIFNPGTENEAFMQRALASGADAFEACTLVMLRTGQY